MKILIKKVPYDFKVAHVEHKEWWHEHHHKWKKWKSSIFWLKMFIFLILTILLTLSIFYVDVIEWILLFFIYYFLIEWFELDEYELANSIFIILFLVGLIYTFYQFNSVFTTIPKKI